jgi:hypothetical protein
MNKAEIIPMLAYSNSLWSIIIAIGIPNKIKKPKPIEPKYLSKKNTRKR